MDAARRQREGDRQFTAPGAEISVLASDDETDGRWSLFEYSAAPGFQGPPPHWHEELIEGFSLLEGELTVSIDGDDRLVGEGENVVVPTQTVDTSAVTEAGPARSLLQVSPAGFEAYFEELEVLRADADRWPPADMEPLRELMSRYDTYAPPVAATD